MAKPTTELLKKLRALMQNTKYVPEAIQAYIVPSEDAHSGEYIADRDKRRAFISGFTGSAGTAVITLNEALMWTDGRYFTQAVQQMDSNWQLMKEGQPDTPSPAKWLCAKLTSSSRVGVDPTYFSYAILHGIQTELESKGYKLVCSEVNLVDLLWSDQPPRPNNPVKPLSLNYTGKPAREKLQAIRNDMEENNATLLVLTALDNIAWTLNLRGSDVSYTPLFYSYLLVYSTSVILYIDLMKATEEVRAHLNEEVGPSNYKIEPYDNIKEDLKVAVKNVDGRVWISENSNYSLCILVPEKCKLSKMTPPSYLKIVKNSTEIEGMKNAHKKDAIALCCYFAWLERHVGACAAITEITGEQKLEEFRKEQKDYVGPSFRTISAVGEHAAIIHYQSVPNTDVPITKDAVYLCDSGGQYYDGTTDITRTLHFGVPTKREKECFTLVLKGVINLATIVFPERYKTFFLDVFARKYLWSFGLDFKHGTGHGIGMYLNVHELPLLIRRQYSTLERGLDVGMFLTNEPGYYEEGKFGFRHEDVMMVVLANTPNNFYDESYFTFETISLVPVQRNMIAIEMLTGKEISYLNNFHKRCRDIIGPLLEGQGKVEAKNWLWKETDPLPIA